MTLKNTGRLRIVATALLVILALPGGCRCDPSPGSTAGAARPDGKIDFDALMEEAGEDRRRSWTFDGDTLDAAPPGFSFARTGPGKQGRWVVTEDPSAARPRVLAQTDSDMSFRYLLALPDEPQLGDGAVSVRCKLVSGKVEQLCGIAVRYVDEDNYYVARLNALENSVRLWIVKNGERSQLAHFTSRISYDTWYELAVSARADHLEVFLDRARVIDHRDGTLFKPGKFGLWTEKDAVTHFDDLRVVLY